MQDINSIPNPDVNSTEKEDRYGNDYDIERENENNEDVENIPLPPTEPKPASIEEPPEAQDKPGINDPGRKPSQIV